MGWTVFWQLGSGGLVVALGEGRMPVAAITAEPTRAVAGQPEAAILGLVASGITGPGLAWGD